MMLQDLPKNPLAEAAAFDRAIKIVNLFKGRYLYGSDKKLYDQAIAVLDNKVAAFDDALKIVQMFQERTGDLFDNEKALYDQAIDYLHRRTKPAENQQYVSIGVNDDPTFAQFQEFLAWKDLMLREAATRQATRCMNETAEG